MSDQPRTATRASARTKTNPSAVQPTTRTTRSRAAAAGQASSSPPVVPAIPIAKKTAGRKPLVQRNNSPEQSSPANKLASKNGIIPRKVTKTLASQESEREPIMAYLRIRPKLNEDEGESSPYLTQLSDTSVRMTDPQDHQAHHSRFRPSTIPPSSTYKFSHIFPPNTSQSEFFEKTTLPLVRDALHGQNGLIFTYGVTNSGKTYTVQGGSTEDSAGILPRAIDVIFNSVEGLQGDGRYRPVRLQGVEFADPSDSLPPPSVLEPTVARVLGNQMSTSNSLLDMDSDSTVIKLDRNYEYSIWIAYAEVYNEKVYDLLETVKNQPNENESFIPRMGSATSLVLTRTALPLKPSPSTDSTESGISGKYISGLRQFRVNTAAEAKALVKLGQIHRRVFGTLANRESSRSHGMVIMKIMRCHRGERNDPTAIQVSRLTLVDLAGSERTKHTHTTGDRLKEAGNINKSLMVLGQCLEVLRQNQKKVAMSLSLEGEGQDGRMDTREVKKGLAIVPFRHSKLTEALMDYFVGDGRTVMIVNVNPYDTGYDENSHVMKFSALAREVYVNPAPAPVQRVPVVGPGKAQGKTIKRLGPMTLKDPAIVPNGLMRKVTISTGGPGSGKRVSQQTLEVLEVDEADEGNDDDGDDDSPINPLVDALFDEIEDLRMQLYESEMRCALIEAETREEVMREMEERMQEMERMYTRRLMKEVEQNEVKTDAKIDMLHQSGLFASPIKKRQLQVESDEEEDLDEEEEEDVEMSLVRAKCLTTNFC
ncbi:kinesin-domain-containing protein [Marasmius fiardii PR-910]|nr:kinesin-domain-containing protein [Marasmius fiardii PR-910]